MHDWNARIISAQGAIIDSLAECELLIGTLYKAYAALFPADADTWDALAREEAQHAAVLRTLHKVLDRGVLFRNIGRFNEENVAPFRNMLATAVAHAGTTFISAGEARCIAVRIEMTLLDSHFYDVVSSDAPEYKKIANAMRAGTRVHLERLRRELITPEHGHVWRS